MVLLRLEIAFFGGLGSRCGDGELENWRIRRMIMGDESGILYIGNSTSICRQFGKDRTKLLGDLEFFGI